ncbi:acyl carrier protein [Streptomyces sp. NPDC002680]|uniref:acyl carrier protein n=1 Tax=Streptomyces sp. NPDC002680 TaxID=3364659 RepID=UPI00369B9BD5
MSTAIPFTLDDLTRILREAAGENGEITSEAEFEQLGYDSLALLETYTRIEREYGISLDEDALDTVRTPDSLIEVVNTHLAAVGT